MGLRCLVHRTVPSVQQNGMAARARSGMLSALLSICMGVATKTAMVLEGSHQDS